MIVSEGESPLLLPPSRIPLFCLEDLMPFPISLLSPPASLRGLASELHFPPLAVRKSGRNSDMSSTSSYLVRASVPPPPGKCIQGGKGRKGVLSRMCWLHEGREVAWKSCHRVLTRRWTRIRQKVKYDKCNFLGHYSMERIHS